MYPPSIRVGIVAAKEAYREGLARLLARSEGFVLVGSWADFEQAMKDADHTQPDHLLVDARLLARHNWDGKPAHASAYADGMRAAPASNGATTRSPAGLSAPTRPLQEFEGRTETESSSRPGFPDRHAGPTLTPREWQIAALIARGLSNKNISAELQLSYSTVKNHVSSILRKLELDHRTQIALYALGKCGAAGL